MKLYLLDTRRDQISKGTLDLSKNTYLKFKKLNIKLSWIKNMIKTRY